jgi:peroxiredoxin
VRRAPRSFATVDAEVDDVRFVGVNTRDSLEEMERFAADRGVRYELLRDHHAELVDGIEAVAFPITLFVTSDGTIIEQTGPIDADQLRVKVAELRAAEQQR